MYTMGEKRICVLWLAVLLMRSYQYLDFEAGLCGLAVCQVLPPMTPGIMALHQGFQSGIYNGDMA